MLKTLKSLDLFSGIGGFALGFHWAGIETAAFCEIEDYPTKVLNKNFPNIPVHRDIKELYGEKYKGIDIITGGFPCQPHSRAGKRRASEDERDLWGEMYRVILEARPKWIVAENVPGLLSSESGRYFGRVLRDLAEARYCTQWFSLSASAVGAWHKRERIWIVANRSIQKRSRKKTDSQHTDTLRKRHKFQKIDEQREAEFQNKQISIFDGFCSNVPDTDNLRKQVSLERKLSSSKMFGGNGENCKIISKAWETEPSMGRVVDGIPRRVDRIKALGNAVVPQIPYLIGKAIIEVENA